MQRFESNDIIFIKESKEQQGRLSQIQRDADPCRMKPVIGFDGGNDMKSFTVYKR